jgi:hypothetical protein
MIGKDSHDLKKQTIGYLLPIFSVFFSTPISLHFTTLFSLPNCFIQTVSWLSTICQTQQQPHRRSKSACAKRINPRDTPRRQQPMDTLHTVHLAVAGCRKQQLLPFRFRPIYRLLPPSIYRFIRRLRPRRCQRPKSLIKLEYYC